MCDTGNFHALYFDPTKAGVMQPGLFPHPCLPDADPKANKKGSSGKDGLAMMGLTRQNQVGNVMLYGTPIVSLFIDGQERLCLAQISNTLLKDYSYNEIHNRRVALGITCLQCTPVQLEILRRAGAMPVSSRRCGLITKREAERLVKSFLEDIAPPQLPEDFKFEVYHECGWGCRGSFLPSRYNSSRAKCIECHFCKGYFSPNKFIFHYHRSHSASYRHPDAANFNSWRRHLKLCDQAPSDGLVHAWEDVKAMFNGGSRKRMLSSPTKAPHSPKIPALSPSPTSEDIGFYSFPTSSSSFPYYPYMSAVADPLHFQRLTQGSMHPAFPRGVNCPRSPSFQSYGDVLRSLSAPYTMMWMQQPSYPKPDMNYYTRPCDGEDGCPQEPKSNKPSTTDEKKQSGKDRRNQTANKNAANSEIVDSSSNDSERYKELPLSDHTLWKVNTAGKKDAPDSGKTPGSDDEGPIEVVEEESKGGNAADKSESGIKGLGNRSETQTSEIVDSCSSRDDKICKQLDCHDNPGIDSSGRISEPLSGGEVTRQNSLDMEELLADNEDCSLSALDVEMASVSSGGYSNMPLEELQNLLSRAKKAREQAEKRNLRLKGSLEDTLRREARIKQELTEQISAMRGSLCSEIEQERKAKELIQMRLKGRPLEVHDALQHISCGLQPDCSDPCSCKGEKAENSNHSA